MDLHQLRVFRSAAVNRGFTRAAEELHLSQSTVSMHIKELEQELGCALFLRVGRRVLPSPAGRLLLEYTEKILHDLKYAEMAVREMIAVPSGSVRLGTGATTLMYRLAPVLSAYQRLFPKIDLIVETGTTELMLDRLKSERLDLAIVMPPVPRLGFRITSLGPEELVLALPPGHPAARKATLKPSDLRALSFILYAKDSAMQNVVDAWFARIGVEPRVAMEMENIEAIKSLVAVGLGAAVVPACALSGGDPKGALRAARVKGFPIYRELGLLSLDSDNLPNSLRELARLICAMLKPK